MATPEGTMYPCVFYNDPFAAIDWLKRVFGFRELMIVRGEDGKLAHSELALGDGIIMVGSAGKTEGFPLGTRSPQDLPGINQSTYIYVSDIRAHYEHAKGEGVEIGHDYEEPEYGGAGYSAYDLEGHPWSFGSYAPVLEAAPAK